jgi:hypothetical protein
MSFSILYNKVKDMLFGFCILSNLDKNYDKIKLIIDNKDNFFTIKEIENLCKEYISIMYNIHGFNPPNDCKVILLLKSAKLKEYTEEYVSNI